MLIFCLRFASAGSEREKRLSAHGGSVCGHDRLWGRYSCPAMDNRISLYAAQYGRCAVTGKELWLDEIHCHHKQPLCRGGTDKYMNLVIVHRDIHRLIHATDPNTIVVYLNLFQLDKKALAKLNALRVLTGQPEI